MKQIIGILCLILAMMITPIAADGWGENYLWGDADMDGDIDDADITYISNIIFGFEEPNQRADANMDGEISVGDMWQVGLIILGSVEHYYSIQNTFVNYVGKTSEHRTQLMYPSEVDVYDCSEHAGALNDYLTYLFNEYHAEEAYSHIYVTEWIEGNTAYAHTYNFVYTGFYSMALDSTTGVTIDVSSRMHDPACPKYYIGNIKYIFETTTDAEEHYPGEFNWWDEYSDDIKDHFYTNTEGYF